jgi:CMP-N-acetylneuraminic acid synthetase
MQFSKIVALVPMRHHSQRVPGKNYREMAGVPLFHHIINTLKNCPEINEIVVDTDSDRIIDGLTKFFPKVTIIRRDPGLTADDVPMNDILIYDTRKVPADLYLQTHSTNPLLTPKSISAAIQQFLTKYGEVDSLFSVSRWQTRLWDEHTQPINHDPDVLLQTQDLPPIYEENSCIYLFTAENLIKRKNRIGERPMMFEIPPLESLDIDEESDFTIADTLLRNM